MSLTKDRPIPGLVAGADVTSDLDLSCDVCVVGSGPGGSMTAAKLAAAGAKVIVLEEGGYYTRKDFTGEESMAFPALYQEHGNRATDDLAITILQGRAVGGGTVVNWTTSYRTPDATLAHWQKEFGLAHFTKANLDPHWDEVEKRLAIHQVGEADLNENNRVLWDGAKKLGISVELLRRNVTECLSTGMCGVGCPTNAKQSMFLTYLPDAAEKGAVVYASCRVDRLELDAAGKVARAVAEVLDPATDRATGRRVVVRAKEFVVSCGAINTPGLLLRSKLPDPHARLGKRTWLHPVVATVGVFDRRIDPFYGAPQTAASHHFTDRGEKLGFFLETPPLQPMLASIALAGFGSEHAERMRKLSHINGLIALHRDGFHAHEEGGTVTLKGDGGRRLSLEYPLREFHWEAMRESMKTMARIQLAAGAQEVLTMHQPPVVIRSEADLAKIDAAPMAPNRVAVFTAHQMGGCAAGKDPKASVVDPELRHHQVGNLRVIDGSVFPTSLGVNPQESILGIASWAADRLKVAAG